MKKKGPIRKPDCLPPSAFSFILSPSSFILTFDSSGGQVNDPVGLGGNGLIVRNHHYSQVLLPVQVAEDSDDFLAGLLVEVAGGLVGQQQPGLGDQGPGDGRPLHLAPGKLARPMLQTMPQPDVSSSSVAAARNSWRWRRYDHVPWAIISGAKTFSSVVSSGRR